MYMSSFKHLLEPRFRLSSMRLTRILVVVIFISVAINGQYIWAQDQESEDSAKQAQNDKEEVQVLLNTIQTGDHDAKLNAIKALGEIGYEEELNDFYKEICDARWLKFQSNYSQMPAAGSLGGLIGQVVGIALIDYYSNDYFQDKATSALAESQIKEENEKIINLFEGTNVVEALEQSLRDGDWVMRYWAAHMLGEIQDTSAGVALIPLLKDSDWHVRAETAKALGKCKCASAGESLMPLLSDEIPYVREKAVEALGNIGYASSSGAVISMLNDSDAWIRAKAAEALGKFGSADALDALIARMDDDRFDVRKFAAEAIGRIGDKRGESVLAGKLAGEKHSDVKDKIALALLDMNSIDKLFGFLDDKDDFTRLASRKALWTSEDPNVVNGLIGILKNGNKTEKIEAAIILGNIENNMSVEALIDATRDKDENIAFHATQGLRKHKDPRAIPRLAELLKHENENIAYEAQTALINLNNPLVVQELYAICHDIENTEATLCLALGVLGNYQDPDATEPLIDGLERDSEPVKLASAYAMAVCKSPETVAPLVAALSDKATKVRSAAAWALGCIGDKQAVEPLIAALKDKEEKVRISSIAALSKINDPAAVDPILAMLSEESDDIRKSAVTALGKLKDPRAVDPLIALTSEKKVSFEIIINIGTALYAIQDSRAVQPLLKMLEHKKPVVRENAAYALIPFKDPQTITPLVEAFIREKEDSVRLAIWVSLKSLGKFDVFPLVEPKLKDKDGDIRGNALRLLSLFPDPGFRDIFQAATSDESLYAKQSAVQGLLAIGDQSAWDYVISLLGNDEKLNGKIIEALAVSNDLRAIEPMISVMYKCDSESKQMVAEFLDLSQDPRAVDALLGTISKDEPNLVAGAYQFFIRRGEVDSIPPMKDSLIIKHRGNKIQTFYFMNCSNSELFDRAIKNLYESNYVISFGEYNRIREKYGHLVPRWGEGR